MHRYNDFNYILHSPYKRAKKLIKKAQEKQTEETLFSVWLALLPNYDKKTYKTFGDFYDEYKPKDPAEMDMRSKDELMAEILNMTRKEETNGTI